MKMDAFANVVSIINNTFKVLSYLQDIEEYSRKKKFFERELSTQYALLITFDSRLGIANTSETWISGLWTLATIDGPLEQFSATMGEFLERMNKHGTAVRVLKWKWTKEEVTELLGRTDRVKVTFQIVLAATSL